MWVAYFQEDGAMRHEIARTKYEHTAQFEADEFVKRMSNPEVGLWWVWIESDDAETGEENNEQHFEQSTPMSPEVQRIYNNWGHGPEGPFGY
jgi:hypothetical protein